MFQNEPSNTRLTSFSLICATIMLTLGLYTQQNIQEKEEIEEENKNLKEESSRLSENVSELEEKVDELIEEVDGLNEDIEAKDKKIEKQKDKIENLKQDKEKLKNTLLKKEEEIKRARTSAVKSSPSANKSKEDKSSTVSDDKQNDPKKKEESKNYTTKTMNVSAYTAQCEGCTGKTKQGTDVTNTIYHPSGHRIVAADPNVIPMGTIIEFNGETFIVDDTGGAIKGSKLDMLVSTKEEARQFGRQNIEVKIYY